MHQKRQLIIAAAIEVVASEGLRKATTAAIADRAGLGEGTLYRYFKNKEELFLCGAEQAGVTISEALLENYDPGYPVYTQYVRLCNDFLLCGLKNPHLFQYLEQYRNAPQGADFNRHLYSEIEQAKGRKFAYYPLNAILQEARKQEIVKNYPLQVLASLTTGPLIFILRDAVQELLPLDNVTISGVAKACWDSIRR